jgi:membrane-associated phospholipid phosphatase
MSRWDRRFRLALVPWAAVMAVSRLISQAHHTSDVLAGSMEGILTGALAYSIFSRREPKVAIPAPVTI